MTQSLSQMQRKASYNCSVDALLTNPTFEESPHIIQHVVFQGVKSSIDEELWKKRKALAKLSQKILKGILETLRKERKPKAKNLLARSPKCGYLLPFHPALANTVLQKEKP